MAGSYTHLVSTGDRRALISVSKTVGGGGDNGISLIEGNLTSTSFFLNSPVAGLYLRFDFQSPVILTEAKWIQQNTASHGTWKWQGSPDASTWTDIGASFTLGGATTQTQTTLAGNTTGYRYYQLLGISGSGDSGPWIHEIEFQAETDPASVYNYYHPQGSGNRTAEITTTWSGLTFGSGTPDKLVNGSIVPDSSNAFWWNSGAPSAGAYVKWDFGSRVVNEIQWLQDNANTHGVWQVQGSPDDSAWTNLGSTFTLGGSTRQTIGTGGNTTAYRYYRLAWQSGALSNGPWLLEVLFATDSGDVAEVPAESLSGTQAPLEWAGYPLPDIGTTQVLLEFAVPVAVPILGTAAHLEPVFFPANHLWATQVCLEVLFPGDWVPPTTGLRNYAYTGGWART